MTSEAMAKPNQLTRLVVSLEFEGEPDRKWNNPDARLRVRAKQVALLLSGTDTRCPDCEGWGGDEAEDQCDSCGNIEPRDEIRCETCGGTGYNELIRRVLKVEDDCAN